MLSVSQGLIDMATRGVGTNLILSGCVITNNPSQQITTLNLCNIYPHLVKVSHIIDSEERFIQILYWNSKMKKPIISMKMDSRNSLVMSWLLHSNASKYNRGYMLLFIAHEIWLAVS